MTWFNLCRIAPEGYRHAAALDEIAETVRHGLEALGHTVVELRNGVGARGVSIALGAHLLAEEGARSLAPGTVVYNLEQIDAVSRPPGAAFLTALGRCVVWDYSERNIDRIRALTGNSRLVHVPVGYVPQLTRIPAHARPDIDVLFYGALNERRRRVLDALRDAGLETRAVFGVYGAERDELIARAKVVLNLHYHQQAPVFEIVRVSYLLANRKPVVAECEDASEVEADLRDAMRLAPYHGLVDACRELVGDERLRAHYADTGFRRMSARKADELLRPAVAAAVGALPASP